MTYLSPTGQGSTTTLGKLSQLIPQLSEGDRLRVLDFAQALLAQKAGKRQKRAARLEQPVDESWRVG